MDGLLTKQEKTKDLQPKGRRNHGSERWADHGNTSSSSSQLNGKCMEKEADRECKEADREVH